MRVIAGQCKGRALFSPKGKLIRPTSDRTKEFIFNYIGNKVLKVDFLELFAGSGNISIEALSRGAQSATLVEKSSQAIRLIHRNIELVNFSSECSIIQLDVLSFLRLVDKNRQNFGLIFADPPYSDTVYQKLVEKIDKSDILRKGGLFVLEHRSAAVDILRVKRLQIKKEKKMGGSKISVYEKQG